MALFILHVSRAAQPLPLPQTTYMTMERINALPSLPKWLALGFCLCPLSSHLLFLLASSSPVLALSLSLCPVFSAAHRVRILFTRGPLLLFSEISSAVRGIRPGDGRRVHADVKAASGPLSYPGELSIDADLLVDLAVTQ